MRRINRPSQRTIAQTFRAITRLQARAGDCNRGIIFFANVSCEFAFVRAESVFSTRVANGSVGRFPCNFAADCTRHFAVIARAKTSSHVCKSPETSLRAVSRSENPIR